MRIDEDDAFNDVNTIEISDDVSIDNLVVRGLRQKIPDDKTSIYIAEDATIRKLDIM
jgi:hypothetical protein